VNNIQIFFEKVQPIKVKKNSIKKQISRVIISESKQVGDISVIFCSDEYLLEINKQFLNHDYYTDVITFDYVEGNVVSGDVFISLDRIKENSLLFNNQAIMELYRVVFHGVLHLIGYNDKTLEEIREMRSKEEYYLNEVDFGGEEL
jgi:rRNA maturation RNase YbeY